MFKYENDYFRIYETSCDFQIESKLSNSINGMGDMVDAFILKGKSCWVGSDGFNKMFKEDLKINWQQYIESYFPNDIEIMDLLSELEFLLVASNEVYKEKSPLVKQRLFELHAVGYDQKELGYGN